MCKEGSFLKERVEAIVQTSSIPSSPVDKSYRKVYS